MPNDTFIARQPIFDRKQNVYGYELLFRSNLENFFNDTRSDAVDMAASRVIADSSVIWGMDELTEGKRAFMNLTRNSVLQGYAGLLPKSSAVLELLETVEPDDELVTACRQLKKQGFTFALDDFQYHPKWDRLIELADIIKIDFLECDSQQRAEAAMRFRDTNIRLLAEKVETQEDYKEGLGLGYAYFQGYFFSKPVVLAKRNVGENQMTFVKLLKQINQPDIDFQELETIIGMDVSLSYKLLRYINSAALGLKQEVRSIRHALVLMGEDELKKWATLLSIASLGEHKPPALITNATIRARFCEQLAAEAKATEKSQNFFMMGLFSQLDAIMDRNIAEVLKEMPIARDIKTALMRIARNRYRQVFEVVTAYESGAWEAVDIWSEKLGLEPGRVPVIYLEAVQWARESTNQLD
jgi:EAL and modified HD-GYP domain-containing signal transduction protein